MGVLIVENNAVFRKLLGEILCLKFPGLQVFEAANGREALHQINMQAPDLVFMDIELGGENGLDIVRRLKAERPNLPIAILTSYDLPEYQEQARQFRVDYFFIKGVSTQHDILTAVHSVLAAREIASGAPASLPS